VRGRGAGLGVEATDAGAARRLQEHVLARRGQQVRSCGRAASARGLPRGEGQGAALFSSFVRLSLCPQARGGAERTVPLAGLAERPAPRRGDAPRVAQRKDRLPQLLHLKTPAPSRAGPREALHARHEQGADQEVASSAAIEQWCRAGPGAGGQGGARLCPVEAKAARGRQAQHQPLHSAGARAPRGQRVGGSREVGRRGQTRGARPPPAPPPPSRAVAARLGSASVCREVCAQPWSGKGGVDAWSPWLRGGGRGRVP